ncbi:MAG TPA: hypothetical protein VMZ50_02150, partial [Phycisphaerae bacterium]|nr:hypothetical protein [Phycisphaerae bacterium]
YPFDGSVPWLVRCADSDACAARVADNQAAERAASAERYEANLAAQAAIAKRDRAAGIPLSDKALHAERVLADRASVISLPKKVMFDDPEGGQWGYEQRKFRDGVRVRKVYIDPDGSRQSQVLFDAESDGVAAAKILRNVKSVLLWSKHKGSPEHEATAAWLAEAKEA